LNILKRVIHSGVADLSTLASRACASRPRGPQEVGDLDLRAESRGPQQKTLLLGHETADEAVAPTTPRTDTYNERNNPFTGLIDTVTVEPK
jgi:hypothetical protein